MGRFPVRLVEFAFACLLRLYPRAFRERYGEEMRAVFLEHCRERGRLAAAAMLTDTCGAAGRQQWHAFAQRGVSRLSLLLALLAGSLLAGANHASIALALGNAAERISPVLGRSPDDRTWIAFMRAEQVRALAMLEAPTVQQRVVGALVATRPLMYAFESSISAAPDPANIEALSRVAAEGLQADDPAVRQLALAVCSRLPACDWRVAVDSVQERDAGNAAMWTLSASLLRDSDPAAADLALHRAAEAPYFNSATALAKSEWLRAAAQTPFERSWWQPETEASLTLGYYWSIEEAMPSYTGGCTIHRPFAACIPLALRWQQRADSLTVRARLTSLTQQHQWGETRAEENQANATQHRWVDVLGATEQSAAQLETMAAQLREHGEIEAVRRFLH